MERHRTAMANRRLILPRPHRIGDSASVAISTRAPGRTDGARVIMRFSDPIMVEERPKHWYSVFRRLYRLALLTLGTGRVALALKCASRNTYSA